MAQVKAETVATAIAALESRCDFYADMIFRVELHTDNIESNQDVQASIYEWKRTLATNVAALADLRAQQTDSAAVGVDMLSDDMIHESVDKVSFDVLHEDRIRTVVSSAMVEALIIDMREAVKIARAAVGEWVPVSLDGDNDNLEMMRQILSQLTGLYLMYSDSKEPVWLCKRTAASQWTSEEAEEWRVEAVHFRDRCIEYEHRIRELEQAETAQAGE